MNKLPLTVLALFLLVGFCGAAERTAVIKVKPSKVSAAKARDREKQFTKWAKEQDFMTLESAKVKGGESMIYFEYQEGKDEYRGIFSTKVKLTDWWWRTVSGENAMEEEVIGQKKRGFEPVFIVLEGNYYRMLFTTPDKVQPTQQLLKELGIDPPVLK